MRGPNPEAEQMRIFPSVCQATYGIWEAGVGEEGVSGARKIGFSGIPLKHVASKQVPVKACQVS